MAKAASVQAERIEVLTAELQGELGQLRALTLWFIEKYADENGEVWVPWQDLAEQNRRMEGNYAPITVNGAWNTRTDRRGEPGHAIVKANLKESKRHG